mgnify:CR=1 FL=1
MQHLRDLFIDSNISIEEIRDKIKAIDYYKYPTFPKSIKWFMAYLIFVPITLVFLDEFFDVSKSNIFTNQIAIIVFIGSIILGVIIPILYYIWFFLIYTPNKNSKRHNQVLSFLDQAIQHTTIIQEQYSELKMLIETDKTVSGIDPKTVIHIRDKIQEITKAISLIKQTWKRLKMERQYAHVFVNERLYDTYIELFTEKYQEISLRLFLGFEETINEWMNSHTHELIELEKSINQQIIQQPLEITVNSPLTLQQIRLQDHIYSLKQVQITS